MGAERRILVQDFAGPFHLSPDSLSSCLSALPLSTSKRVFDFSKCTLRFSNYRDRFTILVPPRDDEDAKIDLEILDTVEARACF